VGAGLTLWSNALIVLKRLGAAERVMATGSRVARLGIRTATGHVLSVTPLGRAEKRFGVPGGVSMHRADLLRELIRTDDPSRVHLRSPCVGIEESTSQVIAQFADGGEDGGEARADFVIGADGLDSVVRSQLFGDASPRYAGYTCWRGVATLDRVTLAPATAFETWGRGRRFSVYHRGRGGLFSGTTHNEPPNGVDGAHGRKADAQKLFSTWHEPIPSVIAATPEILRNDIADRLPIRA